MLLIFIDCFLRSLDKEKGFRRRKPFLSAKNIFLDCQPGATVPLKQNLLIVVMLSFGENNFSAILS